MTSARVEGCQKASLRDGEVSSPAAPISDVSQLCAGEAVARGDAWLRVERSACSVNRDRMLAPHRSCPQGISRRLAEFAPSQIRLPCDHKCLSSLSNVCFFPLAVRPILPCPAHCACPSARMRCGRNRTTARLGAGTQTERDNLWISHSGLFAKRFVHSVASDMRCGLL